MKFSLSFLVVVLVHFQMQAARLVSAFAMLNPQTQKIEVFQSGGFTEDGFSGPNSVCYVGKTSDVCAAFKKEETRIKGGYVGGGHGYITIDSCDIITYQDEWTGTEQSVVQVKYTRTTDYDSEISMVDKTVSIQVRDCN